MIVELNLGLDDKRNGYIVLVRQLGIAIAPVLLELRQATDAAETLEAAQFRLFFTRQPPYNILLSDVGSVALLTHNSKRSTRSIIIIAGCFAKFRC